jgi:hypothetical protein
MIKMDGVLHSSQVDFNYCCLLIKEYSILDSAQIYALLKRAGQLPRRRRQYIEKSLTARGFALRITDGDRSYLARSPGLTPTGKYRAQIICFWVLLDYIDKVDSHFSAGMFNRITLEIGGRNYGIMYVKKGQERLCSANMRAGGENRYFVIVEDVSQIPLIKGDKIHTFAIVSAQGKVEYYAIE